MRERKKREEGRGREVEKGQANDGGKKSHKEKQNKAKKVRGGWMTGERKHPRPTMNVFLYIQYFSASFLANCTTRERYEKR